MPECAARRRFSKPVPTDREPTVSVRANYFKLGLFVLGAMGAAIVLLLVVGSGRWFQPKITFETYFDESVQGLDIGSPIKFRGVTIGTVGKIDIALDHRHVEVTPAPRPAAFLESQQDVEYSWVGAARDICN